MEDYRRFLQSLKYNFIWDTLLIHQVVTLPGKEETILYRKESCGCFPCLNGIYKEWESLEKFEEHPSFVQMVKHTFPDLSWMKMKNMNGMKCLLKQRHPSTYNKVM